MCSRGEVGIWELRGGMRAVSVDTRQRRGDVGCARANKGGARVDGSEVRWAMCRRAGEVLW